MRVLDLELINDPPGGSGIGYVAVAALNQAGVEDTDHPALAVEDERAGVALGGERPGLLVVVVDGELDRLDAEVVADVGLEAGVASDGEVARVAVLHDHDTGLAVAVEGVGVGQELVSEAAVDPELAIGGELEDSPAVAVKVELFDELL